MGRYGFAVRHTAAAPREQVWALVSDAAGWKDWAGIVSSRLEREGDPPPDGVGAIRQFGPPPLRSREQVVEWDPPGRLGYVVLSGMPVRDYRADIRLTALAEEDGRPRTMIEWDATFEERIPGTGRAIEAALRSLIKRFAKRAARAAESRVIKT